MKLIIADTGPVLHLEEAGLSSLLPKLGEVYVTPAVLAELRQRSGWSRPAWLQVAQPSVAALREARIWVSGGMLHAGEAEALAHAREVRPDYFLTDDGVSPLNPRDCTSAVRSASCSDAPRSGYARKGRLIRRSMPWRTSPRSGFRTK